MILDDIFFGLKKKLAFTFIEIMITILVFSVGILSVLYLITNNLKSIEKNNLHLQANILAKEGMELVYNMRDSSINRGVSWNCLFDQRMYSWDQEKLTKEVSKLNNIDFEDVICDGFFDTGYYLQIGFDPEHYLFAKKLFVNGGFFDLYEYNKLYLYSKDSLDSSFSWYGYTGFSFGTATNFARYVSFDLVREGEKFLPKENIIKVSSHVLYLRGGITGEVVFESFISKH